MRVVREARLLRWTVPISIKFKWVFDDSQVPRIPLVRLGLLIFSNFLKPSPLPLSWLTIKAMPPLALGRDRVVVQTRGEANETLFSMQQER